MIAIGRPDPVLDKQLPAQDWDFKVFIQTGEAVYVAGRSYTHEELIRAVAEQMGSAHENEGLEFGLAALQDVLINGLEPYFQVLAVDADFVLELGERVLQAVETLVDYSRKYYPDPLTISFLLAPREPVLGAIVLASAYFYIGAVEIQIALRPQSVVFTIIRNGQQWELKAPLPSIGASIEVFPFCLSYDSRAKRLTMMSTTSEPTVLQANLGALSAMDSRLTRARSDSKSSREAALLLHERVFSEDEIKQLPELLVHSPGIQT